MWCVVDMKGDTWERPGLHDCPRLPSKLVQSHGAAVLCLNAWCASVYSALIRGQMNFTSSVINTRVKIRKKHWHNLCDCSCVDPSVMNDSMSVIRIQDQGMFRASTYRAPTLTDDMQGPDLNRQHTGHWRPQPTTCRAPTSTDDIQGPDIDRRHAGPRPQPTTCRSTKSTDDKLDPRLGNHAFKLAIDCRRNHWQLSISVGSCHRVITDRVIVSSPIVSACHYRSCHRVITDRAIVSSPIVSLCHHRSCHCVIINRVIVLSPIVSSQIVSSPIVSSCHHRFAGKSSHVMTRDKRVNCIDY